MVTKDKIIKLIQRTILKLKFSFVNAVTPNQYLQSTLVCTSTIYGESTSRYFISKTFPHPVCLIAAQQTSAALLCAI